MTPEEAYDKAWDLCDQHHACIRLPELEHIIMTDSWFSYLYAEQIIRGRWIEAEDIIMNDPRYSCQYARSILKSKLPDKMHNMMILHAIKDPNHIYVKAYFKYIK